MNIDELSLYDWVLYNGKPHRVEAMNRPAQMVGLCSPHFAATTDAKNIEPIPLTAEILRRNDFENDNGNYVLWYNDGTDSVEVELKDDNYTNGSYTFVNVNRGCISIFELPVQYVHELQRVLRMCEINYHINPSED